MLESTFSVPVALTERDLTALGEFFPPNTNIGFTLSLIQFSAVDYRRVNASTNFLKTILSLSLTIVTGKSISRIINHHRMEIHSTM